MKLKIAICGLIGLGFMACKQSDKKKETKEEAAPVEETVVTYNFDLEGHRGARGLMPENSIPAFTKAIELGVNTIELDLAVTKDKQVLVSHEPYFNLLFCLDSLGKTIAKKDSIALNIYEHTYKQTQKYDCGSMGNVKFPEQKKQYVTKPLLLDVIALADSLTAGNTTPIKYNIEIKSLPEGDDIYHPNPKDFSDLVIATIKDKIAVENVVLQSFDFRVLQYLHQNYPEYTLAALVYKDDVKTNLDKLGFVPQIYSPLHNMLSKEVIAELHSKNMKVIPWTVNNETDMEELLAMGVDGLITDYPNKAIKYRK
ncbi:glycerophosphodiester phosphodiesterase family protein [Cellulophaga lytica]|uniref:glycerophosphodiester phosphodiesterase family protein n=1 Tax=Cellulophaga lytica TaxID=979 RepID=UPI000B5C810C|nr:glycerophosphodiester phosphodiesterase family protein [Cellulophaga lytica]SNQ44021.1 Glycerophosphoryl diester phosphodiesterase [Cellulophaga lytica]